MPADTVPQTAALALTTTGIVSLLRRRHKDLMYCQGHMRYCCTRQLAESYEKQTSPVVVAGSEEAYVHVE